MSLSKKYLAENPKTTSFDIKELATELKAIDEISFSYILGSAQTGVIKPKSDVDIAIYLNKDSNRTVIFSKIYDTCEKIIPNTIIDIGFLNEILDPVYRFEAIKGNLLFYKDKETWLRFYSITSREYEHQIRHYKKQRQYRKKDNP